MTDNPSTKHPQAPLHLHGLWVHPIKSCAGISVKEAVADSRGLVGDRRWMWIDDSGAFISQRSHPALALVEPLVSGAGVTLRCGGVEPLVVAPPPMDAPRLALDVWGGACEGADAGDAAARWLAKNLNIQARLVVQRGRRDVDPSYAPGHEVGFADGFPLLVASAEAVAFVAERAGRVADARRFRPNVVIAGGGAFVEDQWRRIVIGDVEIELVKPCGRCGVLDVDPDKGVRDVGVLRALRPDRLLGGELRFGMNAVVVSPGRMRVGDSVEVLATR